MRKNMRQKPQPNAIPVVIRYEGEGKPTKQDWRLSDIIAIFPTQPGTNDPSTMSCYSTIGEHSSCYSDYIREKTKPATSQQENMMLRHLRNIGYENLYVIKRISSSYRAMRRR